MRTFGVVSGATVQSLLKDDLASVIDVVHDAYAAHQAGNTVNPDSYFLRFPDRPRDRIIALPAAITEGPGIAGIKWIASFPGNIDQGRARASAILVLNDLTDGMPYACIEASALSAARTAASAVLGALWLNRNSRSSGSIGFVGAGIIARTIVEMFASDGWKIESLRTFDIFPPYATALAEYAISTGFVDDARPSDNIEAVLEADIVVLATTAASPYIAPPLTLGASQIILNVSLRDLDPRLIIGAWNIVDDVDHCLKADTSPHLAERLCGNRDFLAGTLMDLILGKVAPDSTRAKVFSPFGMGILDIALGRLLYDRALLRGEVCEFPDFFAHTARW